MKKLSFVISFLLLTAVFITPLSASAAENAGIKPGSFFYGFVTTFEKVNLFFTFNPEKKAEKALKYAEKRLAEAEAVAGDENSDAVKTAISGYEENIAIAAEASKKVKDETKAENLLNLIADNTSKHQEILSDVLNKVPDEAKEAITKAIEASRKGQEEALNKIAELKGEVEKLKQEVAELKKESNNPQASEVETPEKKQPVSTAQNLQEQKKTEEKPKTTTLPSGAVVEMDVNGNIIRTIKEAPQQTYTSPATAQTVSAQTTPSMETTNTINTPIPATPPPVIPKVSQMLFSPDSSHIVIILDKQISTLRFQKGHWATSATAPQNTTCRVNGSAPIECIIYEPGSYLSVSVISPITPHHLYSDGNINYQLELSPGLESFLDANEDLYLKVGIIAIDGSVYTTNQFEAHTNSPRPVASFSTSQP